MDWILPSGPQLAQAQPENTASIVHPSIHNHHAEHTLSELMGLHRILLVERWYHRLCLCPLLVWTVAKRKTILGKFLEVLASYSLDEDCSRKMGRCEFLSLSLLRIVFSSAKLKMIMLPLKMRWTLRLTWVGGKDFKQVESGDKPNLAKTNSCRDLWKEKGHCCSKWFSHTGLVEAVYPSLYNEWLSYEERKDTSYVTREDWRTDIIRTTNWYSIGQ